MSLSAVSASSNLSQLLAAQQAQASSVSTNAQTAMDTVTGAATTNASASNALTGTNAASLDTQTMQALLSLTQQDPAGSSDPTQSGQPGQTQSAPVHHHHHHGGGVKQPQASDPSSTATDTTDSDASAATAADSGEDTSQASLASTLLSVLG